MNVFDYFLLGYIQEEVFRREPEEIPALIKTMEDVTSIPKFPSFVWKAAVTNFNKRIDAYLVADSGHFEFFL